MNQTTVPNPETPLWRKLINYSPYIFKHRWYVFQEACKMGIPLRGLLHDIDKLYPDELVPYAHRFGGPQGIKFGRDQTGHYRGVGHTGDPAFDKSLFIHLARNDHHWQWWIHIEQDGTIYPMPMSDGARREMVADWRGASRAQGGTSDVLEWYKANKGKLILHAVTRAWCEKEIGYTP